MMYRVSVDYDFCGDDVQLYGNNEKSVLLQHLAGYYAASDEDGDALQAARDAVDAATRTGTAHLLDLTIDAAPTFYGYVLEDNRISASAAVFFDPITAADDDAAIKAAARSWLALDTGSRRHCDGFTLYRGLISTGGNLLFSRFDTVALVDFTKLDREMIRCLADPETAAYYLDDDLREKITASLPWPCTEYDFYKAYLPAHLAKFGEAFTF